jgi:hypothetical protein
VARCDDCGCPPTAARRAAARGSCGYRAGRATRAPRFAALTSCRALHEGDLDPCFSVYAQGALLAGKDGDGPTDDGASRPALAASLILALCSVSSFSRMKGMDGGTAPARSGAGSSTDQRAALAKPTSSGLLRRTQ